MTYSLPAPGPRLRAMSRRLTMVVAAAALALTAVSATVRPARADADDLLRFLAGAIIIGAIIHAIDENDHPRYEGRYILPRSCLETYWVRGRSVDAFNARCLERAGYHGLPNYCLRTFHVGSEHRRAYVAECLYDEGYRIGGGHGHPWPPGTGVAPPIGGPFFPPREVPPAHVSPPGHGVSMRLPSHCEMTYRQSGRRVEGYWADCLREAGLRDLPRHCRVEATDGSRIYTASCLYDAGYRRGR